MLTKDIAKEYGLDQAEFEKYLYNEGVLTPGFFGYTLEEDVPTYVARFKAGITKASEDEEKERALAKILISSGFSFDGYRIVKYSGYISGDDCVTMPRDNFWGSNKVADNLCGALVQIRRQAIKELKEAAYNLGCNAVIGVDFDYMTMDPQHASPMGATVYEPYVICVTANGNAVIIEKE